MFTFYTSAIDKTILNCSEFILNKNKFIRNRKVSFKDFVKFFCFRRGTTNQDDFDKFVENMLDADDLELTRQDISQQRTYINPIVFKEINKQYLREINYNKNSPLFNTFKGFRICAGDGSDFELPNFPEVKKEFQVPDKSLTKKVGPTAKFSGIVDTLNGFILDGIIGNHKESEQKLMYQNLENVKDITPLESTIFVFDRGYNSMEFYANLIDMNTYFVVRLINKFYKKEKSKVKSNDGEIKLNLKGQRIKRFKNEELKEKFSDETELTLRLTTIKLENGETEHLLSNIPKNIMNTEDISFIYHLRWGIETNYNTLKNREYIENYSGKRRITIEQDIYSKFLRHNIFHHYKNYLNIIINNKKRKKGITTKYKVDQANLIRKLNDYLPIMILNPRKKIIRKYTKKIITKCEKAPNKDEPNPPTPRNNKLKRKFNINYSQM